MPEYKKRKLYLWIQLSVAISLIVIIITLLIGFYTIKHEQNSLRTEYLRRILAQTRAIAASSSGSILLSPGESSMVLRDMVLRYLEGNPDCLNITVIDKENMIRGARDFSDIKKTFDKPKYRKTDTENLGLNDNEILAMSDGNFLAVTPIIKLRDVYGEVWALYSPERLEQTTKNARNNVILLGCIIMTIGVGLSIFIANRMVSPINKLVQATLKIGEGDLSYRVQGISSRNEIGILAENFNEMAEKLEKARQVEIDKNIMDREFKLAEDLQGNLLPNEFPNVNSLDIFAICKTAKTVGGDYYDIIQLDEHNIAFVVADISGKGLSGLLVMSLIRNLLRIQARKYFTPKRVLTETNKQLTPDFQKGRFVTVFYGLYHWPTHTLTFSSAGHTPLIHYRNADNKSIPIDCKGRPLGLFVGDYFNDRLEEKTILLSPEDFIVSFTDGVTESVNPDGDLFGEQRLFKLIEKLGAKNNSKSIINGILQEIQSFTNTEVTTDDITILILKSAK
jgi:serine phosphatase RsbU (regulator of sigma subunit)